MSESEAIVSIFSTRFLSSTFSFKTFEMSSLSLSENLPCFNFWALNQRILKMPVMGITPNIKTATTKSVTPSITYFF
jgi:hypothetical protein